MDYSFISGWCESIQAGVHVAQNLEECAMIIGGIDGPLADCIFVILWFKSPEKFLGPSEYNNVLGQVWDFYG